MTARQMIHDAERSSRTLSRSSAFFASSVKATPAVTRRETVILSLAFSAVFAMVRL